MKTGDDIDKAEIVHQNHTIKERFVIKLAEMHTSDKYSTGIMQQLPENLVCCIKRLGYCSLIRSKNKSRQENGIEEIIWLADSFYDIQFKHDSDISERVIFPISDSESRGIEDARFVRF
jgi:hypothetical protein